MSTQVLRMKFHTEEGKAVTISLQNPVDDPLEVAAEEAVTGRDAAPSAGGFGVVSGVAVGEPIGEYLIEDSVANPPGRPEDLERRYVKAVPFLRTRKVQGLGCSAPQQEAVPDSPVRSIHRRPVMGRETLYCVGLHLHEPRRHHRIGAGGDKL